MKFFYDLSGMDTSVFVADHQISSLEVFGERGRFSSFLLPEPTQGPIKPPMQKSADHSSFTNHTLPDAVLQT